jgi:glucose 1-dehydrogenase
MRLKDKVALVTGAGSGIGNAIAARFAAEGAHVAVNYRPGGRSAAPAEELVASLATPGMGAPADISVRAQVDKMVADIVARFGRIDICINNAGIETKKPFVDVSDDEWNAILDVNLFGAFLVTQASVKQMIKQGGGGKVVFISSVHEDIPFVGYTSYCASKGAIRMMMRNLAMELAEYKINCNNIAPGAIATKINESVLKDPKAMADALSEIPWGRFGRPEEVASVAVFLASDEAEYVTGSTYYIDGGLTQQVTKY